MFLYILFFLLCVVPIFAIVPSFSKIASKGLSVDLKSPVYRDGVLQTADGGIIRGKGLFLQAKKIRYISEQPDGKEVSIVEASGNLFMRLHGRIYVGDSIEFDLENQTGTIYNVMTETGPWYIDGKKLVMQQDGSSVISDCTISM